MSTQEQSREFDLGQFLMDQASDGSVESEGEFTVDSATAARKLARFSMPHEYSWVLKLVQAVVGWDTTGLQVRQTRAYTSFTFVPDETRDIPSPKDIVRTILHGNLENQDPISRLCISLRSLVEQTGLSFVLGLCVEKGEVETLFAGPDATALDSATRKAWGWLPERGIRVTVSHQLRGQFYVGRYAPRFMLKENRDVDIAQQLVNHAFLSPVPIDLDGRTSITNLLEHPEFGFTKRLRPFLIVGLPAPGEPPSEELHEVAIPIVAAPERARRERVESDLGRALVVLQVLEPYTAEKERGEHDYQEKARKALVSHLLWVQDGVVVERKSIRMEDSPLVRLILILDATGLETDLTGFSLLNTAEKKERFNQGLVLAKKLVREAFELHKKKLSLLDSDLTLEDRAYERERYLRSMAKQAVGTVPIFLWHPMAGAGVLAGGLILHGVNRVFPEMDSKKKRDANFRSDLRKAVFRLTKD
jgi:hypothetical protein